MQGSTIVWIVLAVVVIVALIALFMSMGRKRRAEAHRDQAEQIRREAQEHDRELREREARAAETEAEAKRARAEAERRAAEAKRLEAEAERRGEHAETIRDERDEQLRRADARDPDVRTDKEGYRLDEDGNRIEDPTDHGTTSGHGVASRESEGMTREGDAGWVDQDGQPVNTEGAHAHPTDAHRSEGRGES